MHEDHEQLDAELDRLAQSMRVGDHMLACLQLAEFSLKLDHFLRREERALGGARRLLADRAPHAVTKTHVEQASLRRLVAVISAALDGADDRRGLEVISKLRSVLLLHVAKQSLLLASASRACARPEPVEG
jgi:hypothetical protein